MSVDLGKYSKLLGGIKARVQRAQTKAMLSANRQMLELYWDVGRMIHAQQHAEGWGAGVLRRLATDLKNELLEIKGFSETNLKRMTQYHRAYPELATIGAQAVPQLDVAGIGAQAVPPGGAESEPQAAAATLSLQLPWGHNVLLLQKVKDLPARLWYMQQSISNGWSRNILRQMILNRAHERQGAATTNFESRLPAPQSDLAQQALKDPYVFDFLVSQYELTRALPEELESALPTIEEIEAELGEHEGDDESDDHDEEQ